MTFYMGVYISKTYISNLANDLLGIQVSLNVIVNNRGLFPKCGKQLGAGKAYSLRELFVSVCPCWKYLLI